MEFIKLIRAALQKNDTLTIRKEGETVHHADTDKLEFCTIEETKERNRKFLELFKLKHL